MLRLPRQDGLELRADYGPFDIVATELFRGTNADERVAEKTDARRLTLIHLGRLA
jgi:hypothetical protein